MNFELLIVNAISLLKPYALKLTKDSEAANDLIQDTICRAWVKRKYYREDTNFKAWMCTIMRNIFFRAVSKQNKRNTIETCTENIALVKTTKNARNGGESNIVLNDINKALAQLSDLYQTPFLMYVNGYKYHEIAEKMKLPLGTVKNRIFCARQQLQAKLWAYTEI